MRTEKDRDRPGRLRALAGLWLAMGCWLTPRAGSSQILDDFSAGDWTRVENTPGELAAAAGALRLLDGPGSPDWVTARKRYAVDLDRTSLFVVKVSAVSGWGTVKLTRLKPDDKREAIRIDQPGVYAVNVREAYGWSGRSEIDTWLYAGGPRGEVTYEYVRFASGLTPEEERFVALRTAWDNPELQAGPFDLVPSFHSCSYYFKSPRRDGLAVQFRRRGEKAWQNAYPPVYVPGDAMYRGSIVRLDEDTGYEVQIREGTQPALAHGEFQTWRSDVPVAETVVLDDSNFDGLLRITRSGTPEGWLRYTAREGFVLRNERQGPLVELANVSYVILDGLTLRGGLQQAVAVRNCEHVRILNCDIAGWGRTGTQRFDMNGVFYTDEGSAINWDTGILVSRSFGTVIERCYIHDPVTTANSWYYAHPAGPQAVGIARPRSTVLRYNDFIGSDAHRWNDAVEGQGNFDANGGFHRDADIHGNFACFANDDAIEIDGGQINVRVFDNWFEGCLCGVSIQGCMAGPSYVFDNLLVNMGDERGKAGQSIKTSSDRSGPGAVSLIFGNTTFGPSRDLALLSHLRIVARNNVFSGKGNISGRENSPQSDCDYNLEAFGKEGTEPHGWAGDPRLVDPAAGLYALREDSPARGRGEPMENFTSGQPGRVDLGAIQRDSGRILPFRPIPILVDRNRLSFTAEETASSAEKRVTATVQPGEFKSAYRIAKNEAFDWFEVTPAKGTLRSGQGESFTVKLRAERMTERALYRGAFLIRLANGYSRPVLVYAATGYQQAVKPVAEGVWTQFIEAECPAGGGDFEIVDDGAASGGRCLVLSSRSKAKPVEYDFTVPRNGKYFLVLRVRGDPPPEEHDAIRFGVDAGSMESAQLRTATNWSWCLAAQNRSMSLICLQSLDLTAGAHRVKLSPRETVHVDVVALTDNPKIFE